VVVGATATLAAAAMLVSVGTNIAQAALAGSCGQLNVTSPPASVVKGVDQSSTASNFFAEKQNVTLAAPLVVDITPPAAFPTTYATVASLPAANTGVPISAGTTVDSFYVHTEPVGLATTHYSGTIRFDQPVLGVMIQWTVQAGGSGPLTLVNSDAALGNPGTVYSGAHADASRGLELPAGGHDDQITFVNADTISFNFLTSTETDDFRIVTKAAPAGAATQGYRFVATDGGVFAYGDQPFLGSTGGMTLNKPIVGGTNTCDAGGYWLVASDGGIFSFGDAKFFGSEGNKPLNKPIVTMAGTPDSKGYWEFASDGGVFTFGDAKFFGSTGAMTLNKPIVSAASSPTGNGYWLAASDGGIFSFGDAKFHGSTGAMTLNKPIVGMAPTADGQGYWLVASDGGIFTFGDAKYYGSTGAMTLNKPIVGMKVTPSGKGYWLVASDGGVFTFGDATFHGSTGNITLNKPIVGVL
jgi:hypothetical protein